MGAVAVAEDDLVFADLERAGEAASIAGEVGAVDPGGKTD